MTFGGRQGCLGKDANQSFQRTAFGGRVPKPFRGRGCKCKDRYLHISERQTKCHM